MALRGALVDRCFIQRKNAGMKVRGREVYTDKEGPEIRCRLTIAKAGERLEDGRVLTEPTPTLWIWKTAVDGTKVEIRATDTLRVVSPELGEHMWAVDGEVAPARKKRRILGWEATVKRVEENEQPQEIP